MVTVFVVPSASVLVPEMVFPESVSPPGRLPTTEYLTDEPPVTSVADKVIVFVPIVPK
jgi:hypothetical protein